MFRTTIVISAIIFAELFISAFFISDKWYADQLTYEHMSMKHLLGENLTYDVYKETKHVFTVFFVDTGVRESSLRLLDNYVHYTHSNEGFIHSIIEWYKTRINVIWFYIYQVIERSLVLALWLPYAIPLFLAAIVDGMVRRKIKKHSYGYTSPVIYHTSTRVMFILAFFPLIYLLVPTALPAIVSPVWLLVMAFFLQNLFSNIQKHI